MGKRSLYPDRLPEHSEDLQLTLFNGYDEYSKKQLGLQLGYAKDFKTFDELWLHLRNSLSTS